MRGVLRGLQGGWCISTVCGGGRCSLGGACISRSHQTPPTPRVFGYKNICMPFRTFVCGLCKAAHQAFSHRVKVRCTAYSSMHVSTRSS